MPKRTALFLLAAVLLAAGTVPVPAAAQIDGPKTCEIRPAPETHDTVAAAGLFAEVCPVPAGFAQGLVLLKEGYAVADRHEDAIVFFDRQGQRLRTLEYPAYEPSALAWDGAHLVAADRENGRIYFIDPQSGEAVRMIESPLTPVVGIACNAEGQLWVAAAGSDELQLIDPYDGTTLASIKAPAASLNALAFDPDGYLWAADAKANLIYLVDIRTGYTIFGIASPGPVPEGLWLDGKVLHVSDYQTDTVYRTDVYALNGICLRSDERRGHVTLFSEVQNLGPGTVTGGTMVVAIPTDGPNQDLESLEVTAGGRPETDQWGQQVSVFDLGELAPGKKLSVRLDATGTFHRISTKIFPHLVGKESDIPRDIRDRYLVDADKYRVQGDYIQGKVKEIVGDETNLYFKARKLYDFLIGRINYQMVGGWDIAPTVIERGTGSCSEYTFSVRGPVPRRRHPRPLRGRHGAAGRGFVGGHGLPPLGRDLPAEDRLVPRRRERRRPPVAGRALLLLRRHRQPLPDHHARRRRFGLAEVELQRDHRRPHAGQGQRAGRGLRRVGRARAGGGELTGRRDKGDRRRPRAGRAPTGRA